VNSRFVAVGDETESGDGGGRFFIGRFHGSGECVD
jgi:hypothetical protein